MNTIARIFLWPFVVALAYSAAASLVLMARETVYNSIVSRAARSLGDASARYTLRPRTATNTGFNFRVN